MRHKTEAQWEAEGDLNTLIDAEKIKGDKKRLTAAMKHKRALKKDLEKVGK